MVKPKLSRKKLAKIPLSLECKALILGAILGDGSLKKHKGYANARFKFRHSAVQRDYFEWKVSLLSEIATPKSVIEQPADGYSKNEKLLFQSCACTQLTSIWESVGGKKFAIERRWLNHMSALSLAIWWFDDGSLVANRRRGVICTDSFPEAECEILVQYLKSVWSIKSRAREISNTKRYRLHFYTAELKKLLCLILPYAVTPFTVKKCFLKYDHSFHQQRWISEMREYLPAQGLIILDDLQKMI